MVKSQFTIRISITGTQPFSNYFVELHFRKIIERLPVILANHFYQNRLYRMPVPPQINFTESIEPNTRINENQISESISLKVFYLNGGKLEMYLFTKKVCTHTGRLSELVLGQFKNK